MKSIKEVQSMLVSEIRSILKLESDGFVTYYDKITGDFTFLLAGLLDRLMKVGVKDENSEKWIDDSLVSRVIIINKKVLIWGIIIWGKEDTTEQWTGPFHFEIIFNQDFSDFSEHTFLFGDLDMKEISYEKFNMNREYWGKQYYLDNEWNPSAKNWEHIIHSKNEERVDHHL